MNSLATPLTKVAQIQNWATQLTGFGKECAELVYVDSAQVEHIELLTMQLRPGHGFEIVHVGRQGEPHIVRLWRNHQAY